MRTLHTTPKSTVGSAYGRGSLCRSYPAAKTADLTGLVDSSVSLAIAKVSFTPTFHHFFYISGRRFRGIHPPSPKRMWLYVVINLFLNTLGNTATTAPQISKLIVAAGSLDGHQGCRNWSGGASGPRHRKCRSAATNS